MNEAISLSNTSDLKKKLSKSILICGLFYIYTNIFLFNVFITLFALSALILYYISLIVWDRTNKALSCIIIAVYGTIISLIFVDLVHNKYYNDLRIVYEPPYSKIIYSNASFQDFSDPFNIILIETNLNRRLTDFKQNCAIESAARNNPNANVMVFTLSADMDSRLINEYRNINLVKKPVEDLFNGTPLFDWWQSKSAKILASTFFKEHLSDGLRLSLLYKVTFFEIFSIH